MIGVIVELLISWILIRFIEKKNLEALGLFPYRKRLIFMLAGFTFSLAFVSIQLWLSSTFKHKPYILNANYTISDFTGGCWYVIKSVCFEELIFRGALLYILINRIGVNKAIAVSALAFGIYHWFSFGVIGNPVTMVFVLITTGLVGVAYAYSFWKTGTIWMPLALHLGYNFTTMIVFSNDNRIGDQFLIHSHTANPVEPSLLINIAMMVYVYLGYPFLSVLLAKKIAS